MMFNLATKRDEFGPRLADRRVLVVGGGQRMVTGIDRDIHGNGRASCLLLAHHGARIACADMNGEAARATCEEVQASGGVAFPIIADVRRPADIDRMVSEAAQLLGGLDGLLLNVGIGGGQSGLAAQTPEVWDEVFAINVRAHAFACRAALPLLSDDSSIIFISSVASLRPVTGLPAYEASKAALDGLCRNVALEGEARNIRANIVVPGFMDTPNGRAATARRPERAALRKPLGRQGTAWDVANAVLFLLSAESSYVNAQSLAVDGGYVALGFN